MVQSKERISHLFQTQRTNLSTSFAFISPNTIIIKTKREKDEY